MLLVHLSHAQQNATYPLNDPRNPDCPCHKLQKQAEEEYARQHKTVAVTTKAGNTTQVKKKRKKCERWDDLVFRCSKRVSNTKKMKPDYTVCYRW